MTTTASWSERVALRHAASTPQSVRLREPCGSDELALAGIDTLSGARWLDALLDDTAPCSASALGASDRDALYAALHRGLWGDRIVASLHCPACDAWFDLSFELSSLQRRLADATPHARPSGLRSLRDDDPADAAATGHALALPDALDEDHAARLGAAGGAEALAAAVVNDAAAPDRATLARRLEALAPLLDVDLDAACAECGHGQQARFDIQSYVLQRLLDEREQVLGEVHALASGYGWSLGEIGALPRSLRRAFAARLRAAQAGLV